MNFLFILDLFLLSKDHTGVEGQLLLLKLRTADPQETFSQPLNIFMETNS